jgi:hypothetical protein
MGKFKQYFLSGILGASLLFGCSQSRSNPTLPTSLERIVEFTSSHIEYESEEEDFWQSPTETLKIGYGDCDDIALVNCKKLKDAGFKPKILLVQGTSGHAVAITKYQGKYFALEHHKLLGGISSLQELLKRINRYHSPKNNYDRFRILDPETKPDWETTLQNLVRYIDPAGFSRVEENTLEQRRFYLKEKLAKCKYPETFEILQEDLRVLNEELIHIRNLQKYWDAKTPTYSIPN